MKWVSLSVRCPPAVQEAIANFLVEQTERGVQIEGQWVTAYCFEGEEAQVCHQQLTQYYRDLQQLHLNLAELKVRQKVLPGEDWSETWKSFFKPLTIGKNIVIKPTWEPYEPKPGQVLIEIDPGRAFGTGKHPSTALCLEILELVLGESSSKKMGSVTSVLDVGTGSGILGIAAAGLGARRVLGLDLDPEALKVAEENLRRNGVEGIMSVSSIPLHQLGETYDLVVANLTAPVIIQMAANLSRSVSPKGCLVLSGILSQEMEEVAKSFRAHYFECIDSWAMEEWRALLLRRKSRA
ncbi:MAG: 50S ribosomal protein L11 methyltransferase [Deltaproteobacteria bacterium]|nr:50S ribosomal protein L11 methyltransferase [Deltaproteobacteria bacterium]